MAIKSALSVGKKICPRILRRACPPFIFEIKNPEFVRRFVMLFSV
tara:strand:- start:1535 stop:1669 length:135 start_codon:yes stop_codon:yes gene_type:complete